MHFNIADNFNNILFSYAEKNKSFALRYKFYQGESERLICDILKAFAPAGKVAVLYTEDTFNELSLNFTSSIKKAGYICTNLVVSENFKDDTESYSKLFNLAEDIRMIITADIELYNAAEYFATIRGIECLCVLNKLSQYDNIFPYEFKIKNGKDFDVFKPDCFVHTVINVESILSNENLPCDMYAHTLSYALALVDYRINGFYTGEELNALSYYLCLNAVKRAYSVFSHKYSEQKYVLLYSVLETALACLIDKGKLNNVFATNFAVNLTDKTEFTGKKELLITIALAKIYKLSFCEKYKDILFYPDYLERSEYLCSKIKYSQNSIIKGYIFQSERIAPDIKPSFSKEKSISGLDAFIACSNSVLSAYRALGGNPCNDIPDFRNVIKHAGDNPNVINGMTLVRESGIAELIK